MTWWALSTVDWAVIKAILKVSTAGQFDALQPDMQKWCKHVITLPYHLGGFGITPLVQSGKAGFYSATAKFISWLGTLPNAQFWLPAHHDLHQPDTWSCQRLTAFIDLHRHFCSELNFTEWAPPAAIANDQVPPPRSAVITLPPPTLLARLHCKCYCGKTMTTQHIAPRSRRNATSRVRS